MEDDPGTQELFKSYLEGVGLQVTVAGNGEEAETALDGFTPDIILLDLVMPVMDGTAFLQRLRMNPARVEIPVIICTGKELSSAEQKRLQAQAAEILAKGSGFEADLMAVLASFFPLDVRISPPPPPRRGSGQGAPGES